MIKLMCILDKEANQYQRPFPSASIPEATRQIALVARRREGKADNILAEYPADYSLMCIGTFDELTGKVTIPAEPEFICDIADIVEGSDA